MRNTDLKILLVDDQDFVLEILSEILSSSGYTNIISFSDPLQARHYLLENNIDVLITDYDMPSLNGLQLLDSASSVPHKFMISGTIDPDLRCQSISKGALPIDKPFKPETIIHLLDTL